jgi:hypothetical protein
MKFMLLFWFLIARRGHRDVREDLFSLKEKRTKRESVSVPTLSCSPSKEAIDPVLQSFHNRSPQRNTRSALYERVIGPSREAIVPVLQSFHNRPRQQRKDRPALHERVIGRSIISSIKGSHRPSASILSQPFKATKEQIRNLHFTRESSILIIFTIKGSHRPSVL